MAKNPEISILNELDLLEGPIQQTMDGNEVSTKLNKGRNNVTILHLNVRSIRKNFNNLMTFLQAYNLKQCDILVLSECWQIDNEELFGIKGYITYYNNAKFNQNDGIIIFINSKIQVQFQNVKLSRSHVTLTKFYFRAGNVEYGVTCGYRSPSSNITNFLIDLEEYFTNDLTKQVNIFLGDLNIDILVKNDAYSRQYLSILNMFGYESRINGYTRVTPASKSCIDHIFVKYSLDHNIDSTSFIIESEVTDHLPILIEFFCREIENGVNNKIERHIIESINEQRFENIIKLTDWTKLTKTTDPQTACELFFDTIKDIVKKSTDIKEIKTHNKKIKPWITNGLVTAINTRDKMKKRLLLNYNDQDERAYKKYRNDLHSLIQKCKHDYYKEKIEQSSNDIKKIYKIINEATDKVGSNRNNEFLKIKKDVAGSFTDLKELANYCNTFFNEVGLKMSEKIPDSQNKFNLPQNVMTSMFLYPVNENELIKHMSTLKNKCTPGVDKISAVIIKRCHLYFLKPLKHIINLIFLIGMVPSEFKTAIITPIFKSNDSTKINNYRPISVISNFTKIFEKCLKQRLQQFLNNSNVLTQNQYAFTGGRGTTDAMYELVKNVINNLDSNQNCLAVFLDLAKAFDTIPHPLLLDVLQAYGVRGVVLDVFASYLSGRRQMVKINSILSEPLEVKIGIPQGTVLGPILFIIYINSLTNIDLENGSVISYADDTAIVFKADSWDNVRILAESGIRKTVNWLKTYRLTLNIEKTNYIAFSLTSANRPMFTFLSVNNDQKLKEVESIKYLGVIVDKHLKWDLHVMRLCNNMRRMIYKFYVLREILNKKVLINIYKSLVESLIRYGLIIWGGIYNNSIKQLSVVQNYILKVIHKRNKRYPTSLLYSEEIMDTRCLYILSVCGFARKSLLSDFEIVNHSYSTRSMINRQLKIPCSNTSRNQRFITYLAPKFYNLIPNSIKQITSKKLFYKKCSQFIVSFQHKFNELL